MVVLHHTAMRDCAGALERLCDPASEVSCHYLIGEDGTIWQLVDEEMRAWHAGAGCWGGVRDVNSHSIGIELANPGPNASHPPFAEKQMAALESLLADIIARRDIRPENVLAHSDTAPRRKADPGPGFDWRRLALAGLSVWPEGGGAESAADQAAFLRHAERFGYCPDAGFEPVLAAFRLRFRPTASGPLVGADMAMMAELASRWPARLSP